MASLVDTTVLVYRVDPRDPIKQRKAAEVLREGLVNDSLVVAHQCIVEFVAVVTRPRMDLGGAPLLRATAMYGLSWFDASLWAYAESNGIAAILSEDFEHGRHYGTVRVVNPFLPNDGVHALPALYDVDDHPDAVAARSSDKVRSRARRTIRPSHARAPARRH